MLLSFTSYLQCALTDAEGLSFVICGSSAFITLPPLVSHVCVYLCVRVYNRKMLTNVEIMGLWESGGYSRTFALKSELVKQGARFMFTS